MTAAVVCMNSVEARAITDRIKTGVDVIWELITRAYTERAWDALGYPSWDDYCTREFGTSRLRLPREERTEIVASLRESGLSVRAIASAMGTGTRQVQEAIRENQLCSKNTVDDQDGFESDRLAEELIAAEPVTITGTNGKSYPAAQTAPREPRRRPITEAFDSATYELKRSVERVTRLTDDDRFTKNKDQISGANLSDLVRVRDALTGVIQQIEG